MRDWQKFVLSLGEQWGFTLFIVFLVVWFTLHPGAC